MVMVVFKWMASGRLRNGVRKVEMRRRANAGEEGTIRRKWTSGRMVEKGRYEQRIRISLDRVRLCRVELECLVDVKEESLIAVESVDYYGQVFLGLACHVLVVTQQAAKREASTVFLALLPTPLPAAPSFNTLSIQSNSVLCYWSRNFNSQSRTSAFATTSLAQ